MNTEHSGEAMIEINAITEETLIVIKIGSVIAKEVNHEYSR